MTKAIYYIKYRNGNGGIKLAKRKNDIPVFKYEGRSYIETVHLKKVVFEHTWKMAVIALVLNFIGAFIIWLLTENNIAAVIPILCTVVLFLVIESLNSLSGTKDKDMA